MRTLASSNPFGYRYSLAVVATGSRHLIAGSAITMLLIGSAATAQVDYTFTSAPGGDGFTWPASPTGLVEGDFFETPDGIEFDNYTGNNMFFDTSYQVVGNAPGFSNEALWGNPLDTGFETIDIYFFSYGTAQTVAFDFAWSVGGSPGATPDEVNIYLEDSEGRATDLFLLLEDTFTGFGGFDGYADRLFFDAADLVDDYEVVDGGPFVDISFLFIYVGDIVTGGPASEYGIDNFSVDGAGGGSEVYPSVNNGAFDVSGAILGRSVLRGTGTHTVGIEVTNGSSTDTTYSTSLDPGSELADNGQISNAPILGGQTIFTPAIVSIDRSQPSETYDGDVTVINEENPGDPDDTVTLRVRLLEPPDLTAPSPVDVDAAEKVELSNAAAPTNGHRASVKVLDTSIVGPFAVTGYEPDTPLLPGEMIQGDATISPFGYLSGGHSGTLAASLEMTTYTIINNEPSEFLLFEAEPIPDVQWTLNGTVTDMPADNADYATDEELGPRVVGVNSDVTATTLVGGTATANGSVSMMLQAAQEGTTTGVIGQATDVNFTTSVPVHVVQITYNESWLCPDITEANLRLLHFNAGTSDWDLAVNGNSDGGAGETFYAGSFEDFAATLGGAPLSNALSTHGLDTVNNRAWAILDHEGLFGTGEIGRSCHVPGDCDGDGDVDADDVALFEACASGPAVPLAAGCEEKDFDGDDDVDHADFSIVQRCFSGEGNPGDPDCAD